MKYVRILCAEMGVELNVFRLREMYGFTVDEAVACLRGRRVPCSICGMIKRKALNDVALKLGIDKLATGHTLNDEATFLLASYKSGCPRHVNPLGTGGTKQVRQARARIKPLYESNEKETITYRRVNAFHRGKMPLLCNRPSHQS